MFYIYFCFDMFVGLFVLWIFFFFLRYCGVGCYYEFIFFFVDLNFINFLIWEIVEFFVFYDIWNW